MTQYLFEMIDFFVMSILELVRFNVVASMFVEQNQDSFEVCQVGDKKNPGTYSLFNLIKTVNKQQN